MATCDQHSERGEDGLTEIKRARIEERSLKWNQASVKFDLHKTREEVLSGRKPSDLSAQDKMLVRLHDHLNSKDKRVQYHGQRIGVQMAKLNHSYDHLEATAGIPQSAPQVNVNVGVQLSIQEDDNWYGNAHRLPPESTRTPDSSSD
jgi:hypothetical protein